MVSYEAFRKKSNKESCEKLRFMAMIENAASSCMVRKFFETEEFSAAISYTMQEFYTEGKTYTPTKNNVVLGDVLVEKDRNILILAEIIAVKGEEYIKRHTGVLCNYVLDGTPVFMLFNQVRNIQSKHEMEFFGKIFASYSGEALMIAPTSLGKKANESFLLGGRQWRIKEVDDISSPGVRYYSLMKELITIHEDLTPGVDIIPEVEEDVFAADELLTLVAGSKYKFETEAGVFKASKTVSIISKTQTEVIVEIPFGIKEITIETKEFNNDVSRKYLVK